MRDVKEIDRNILEGNRRYVVVKIREVIMEISCDNFETNYFQDMKLEVFLEDSLRKQDIF